jgi:plastocyanin
MRRPIVVFAILALALAGEACAKKLDTGFPPASATEGTTASASPSAPTTPVTAVTLVAKNIAFNQTQLLFKANEKITVTLDNQDAAIPHDFGLYANKERTQDKEIFDPGTKQVTGPGTIDYTIPALKAGTYYFQCNIHPSMNGTAEVE